MDKRKLKIAVLGLDDAGQVLAEAAEESDCFDLAAIADEDKRLVGRFKKKYGCAGFDDYRQLVVQGQFDCLIVAAGLHSCDEFVRMAIKKKFNVLKTAPAARDFEEAVEYVRFAQEQDVILAVANTKRFSPSFVSFREFLTTGKIDQVFLIEANCFFSEQQDIGHWQSDPKLAGGGVLLRNCYQMIDQIVSNFSMPEQVYSLKTNQAVDRKQRSVLTEDTVIVTMKFSDNLFGNLTASRRAGVGPKQQVLKIYGKDRTAVVSETGFVVTDELGQAIEEHSYETDELYSAVKMLEDFAMSVLEPEENKVCSSGFDNLTNMAVIESAYLSARTGMPEEPQRVLDLPSWSGISNSI